MTALYRPVLIESAEQAESLPDGTLAHGHWPDRQYGDGLVKKIGGAWMPKSVTEIGLAPSDALVGWTALVPIEAEEERVGWGFCTPGCERTLHSHYPRTRLVTPWEEA
ncbi:hypothetical protein [Brachybacterium paraconglomeratum]|uniref:hypothetical protein n=1 Tax=Brachybacterium paraconglomeratum TaxID=173362 RepID=UPI0022E0C1AF|nr:hypothetical protein [Brachybacterium paraconglomeratum]